MARSKKVNNNNNKGKAGGSLAQRRKTNVFKQALGAAKKAVKQSKCTDLNKLARIGLKAAKTFYKGRKNAGAAVPRSVSLGADPNKKGGSILAILSAIAAATSIISGATSVVQAYKRSQREAAELELHKDRNQMLETYLLAESTKKKSGGSIFLRRNKRGTFSVRICPLVKKPQGRRGQ
jgi:hypothetical protein